MLLIINLYSFFVMLKTFNGIRIIELQKGVRNFIERLTEGNPKPRTSNKVKLHEKIDQQQYHPSSSSNHYESVPQPPTKKALKASQDELQVYSHLEIYDQIVENKLYDHLSHL